MDFHYSDSTLVIRGKFLAVSTGVGGDLRRVDALFNHTVPRDWHDTSPKLFLSDIAREEGICGDYFGLLTAVPMSALLICRSGFLTVFITAGISNHTINIIAVSTEGMSKNALLESVATISSAKTQALLETGRGIVATPTDAAIMACEGEEIHQYAGIVTAVGGRLAECVRRGVPIALSRYENNSVTPVILDFEASRME
ncbi:MAG: Adenosylcobinamide amidohydrolase [Methanoregulaceae archaeon PtaB.Bin009]|nr:MAG: Adenosylcobinamide amidohydrolase [Methanoregulaceae archaeon PtaB.Bin009]